MNNATQALRKKQRPEPPQGRPPKLVLDEKTLSLIEGAASVMATLDEIAAVLKVDKTTFIRFKNKHPKVQELIERGTDFGKASLRRTQFRLAEKNAAMAIHLGLNYLGQQDRRGLHDGVAATLEVTDQTKRFTLSIFEGGRVITQESPKQIAQQANDEPQGTVEIIPPDHGK